MDARTPQPDPPAEARVASRDAPVGGQAVVEGVTMRMEVVA